MPTEPEMPNAPASTLDAAGFKAGSRAWGLTLGGLWTVLAIGLPVLGSLTAPMSTVDLAYQVRAGQLMLESGSILTTDPFTFTVGGEPWLNQQWGAGVLFGVGYDAVGWAGLAILRGLLIGLSFGLVLAACRASGAGPRTAALVTIAAFAISLASLGLRAQLLGMVLFAGTLAILACRSRRPLLLWLLPALFVAWANLHGSFVIGLAAIGAALLDDIVAHRPGWRRLGVVALGCAAATLLNPFGVGVWVYAFNLTTSSQVTRLITEWQPTSLSTYTGLAFAASAIATAGLLAWRGRSVGWPVLAWLAALFLVGLYAERGVAWWALGATLIAASLLARAASPPGVRLSSREVEPGGPATTEVRGPASTERRRPLNLVVAIALGIGLLVALPTWRGGDSLYGPDGLLLDAPQGVTETLRELATPDDRVFASQQWASWFELVVPGVPVMVDARIEVFSDDVWTDYLAISAGRQDWTDILDRWGVTIIAVDRLSERNLLAFVATESGWSLIHDDEEGFVYARRDRSG